MQENYGGGAACRDVSLPIFTYSLYMCRTGILPTLKLSYAILTKIQDCADKLVLLEELHLVCNAHWLLFTAAINF